MSTPVEEWKSVVGWEGLYEVSSFGRVRNVKRNRLRKVHLNQDGYPEVGLSKRGKATLQRVHQLVLRAFVGPPPFPDAVCRHLNGIRIDNRSENLAWGTVLENVMDKTNHGTMARGLHNGGWSEAKLTEEDVRRIRESVLFGARKRHLSKTYNVCRQTIYNALSKTWVHVSHIGV